MEVVDLEYLRLVYRSDLHLLFMRWTRAVSSDEHRAGYAAALELARRVKCSHWQIDLRIRGLSSAEDFAWILRDFRPLMADGLPAPRRLAYLLTPYQADIMNARIQELNTTLPATTSQVATVRAFIEEMPAQHWLQSGT